MLKFRRFAYLLEKKKPVIDWIEGKSKFYPDYSETPEDKFWNRPHTITTSGGWTVVVPALGGNDAKGVVDISLRHKKHFKEPVNLELKTNKSVLATFGKSDSALREIAEKSRKFSVGTSPGGTRSHIAPRLEAMKHYLKHTHGIKDERMSSPSAIVSIFNEIHKKEKEEGKEVHLPPGATELLEHINKSYSDKDIHGIFMSDDDTDDFRTRNREDAVKEYRHIYHQIHQIIDLAHTWEPPRKEERDSTESSTTNTPESSTTNRRTKMWSTSTDDHRIHDKNDTAKISSNRTYEIKDITHKGVDYRAIVPVTEDESEEEIHGENLSTHPWSRRAKSKIYRKRKKQNENGEWEEDGIWERVTFNKRGRAFRTRHKETGKVLKLVTEDDITEAHKTIQRKNNGVRLGTEAFRGITSGFDPSSDRHVFHQFLDDEYERRKPRKEQE